MKCSPLRLYLSVLFAEAVIDLPDRGVWFWSWAAHDRANLIEAEGGKDFRVASMQKFQQPGNLTALRHSCSVASFWFREHCCVLAHLQVHRLTSCLDYSPP